MSLLIKNGIIVDTDYGKDKSGEIFVENGKISCIGEELNVKADEVIDAQGKYILPGFVDMYSKICEAGYENKKNLIRISNSAAKGGFTSITSSPKTQPVIDNKTVVEYAYSEAEEYSKVNIFPYGSITKGCEGKEPAEIAEMVSAGAVALCDGGKSISDASLLRDVMNYSQMFDIPMVVHCLDPEMAANGVINYGYMSTKLGLVGIPREAEEIMVARNIVLARYTGVRLHLSHITTKGSVELIRGAKADGVNITAGTCPHYFSLSEEAVENFNTFAKVMPPLRTEEDIEAIKEGLKDGVIDTVASGHTPVSFNRKNTEFGKAAFGISSLETAFSVCRTYLDENDFSIYDFANILSRKPAEILRLENKGSLKVGKDADIIIVDKDAEFVVDENMFASKARYSPYTGRTLKGRVLKTIVGGRVIGSF